MEKNFGLIKKIYYKKLPPMMFTTLGCIINVLIDTALISKSLGVRGIAALNLCMPVYLFICMMGMLFSTGAFTLSARAAGRNDPRQEREYYHTSCTLFIITGAFLSAAGIILLPVLCGFLSNGNMEVAGLIYDYVFVTMSGALPMMTAPFFLMYLNLEDKNREMEVSILIMVISDFLLDLLLMYVLGLGMKGAAAASVISSLTASAYSFIELGRGSTNYRFNIKELGFKHTVEIIRYGTPSALANLEDTIKALFVNRMIMIGLGTGGIALLGVLNTLMELSLAISSGVPMTAAPMTAMFYSSKDNGAVRYLVKLQMRAGIVLMSIFAAGVLVLSKPIGNGFQLSENIILPLLCMCLFLLTDIVTCVYIRHFNSTGMILVSNILNIIKRLGCPVLMLFILSRMKGYLWMFLPAGGLMSLILNFAVLKLVQAWSRKKEYPYDDILLLDDHLQRENKILDFSLHTDAISICEGSQKIIGICQDCGIDLDTAMDISLSMEEMMMALVKESPEAKSINLRLFVAENGAGLQIQVPGEKNNIFEHDEGEAFMGVDIIKKIASRISFNYEYIMECNTYQVFFKYAQNGMPQYSPA